MLMGRFVNKCSSVIGGTRGGIVTGSLGGDVSQRKQRTSRDNSVHMYMHYCTRPGCVIGVGRKHDIIYTIGRSTGHASKRSCVT